MLKAFKTRTPFIIILVLGLFLITGCSTKANTDGSSTGNNDSKNESKSDVKDPYVIGAVLNVTTEGSTALGEYQKNMMEALQEKVNAQGGINGHPLKIIIYDDEGKNDKTLLLTKKLIDDDKVIALMGGSLTAGAKVSAPIAESSKVPYMYFNPVSSMWEQQPMQKYVFQICPKDAVSGALLAKYMKSKNYNNLVLIYDQDPYGAEAVKQYEKVFQDNGLNILEKISYNNKSADLSSEAGKAYGKKPDAVVLIGLPPGPAKLATAMRARNWDVPLIGQGAVNNPNTIKLGGKNVEGLVVVGMFDPGEPDASDKEFVEAYKTKTGNPPPSQAVYAWDAVNILVQTLAKVGPDRDKVRNELENLKNYQGSTGTFNWSSSDHNGISVDSMILLQVKDGKFHQMKN